jgi:hypothetical protein
MGEGRSPIAGSLWANYTLRKFFLEAVDQRLGMFEMELSTEEDLL